MKKLSLMLALAAAAMLPVTAMAQDTTKSKSSKKKGKSSASASSKGQAHDDADSKASGNKTDTVPRNVAGKRVVLSDEQIMLSNRAVEAANSGNYKEAELYYTASLKIGESNLVWYNQGFAQLKQDKCIAAKESFEHVATAPILDDEDITPESVNQVTEKAMKQLREKCTASFKLNCSPQEMEVTIDSDSEIKCDDTEYAVIPGKHSLTGRTEKGFNTVVVDLPANMLTIAPIEVIDYEAIVDKAGITPEELQKRSTLFKALGYTFIGVGVAAAATGAVLDWYYWDQYRKDYKNPMAVDKNRHSNDEKVINIGYALIGVGSAMAVTGIILVVYDAVSIQPQYEELSRGRTAFVPTFAPMVTPDFTGFSLSTTF